MKTPRLDALSKKGTDFLGTRYAILGGAMSWVSDHHLVSAISNAGGFGVLAGGNMPGHLLEDEITKTFKNTNKPFGVNMITVTPFLDEQTDVVVKSGVNTVIFAGGIPQAKYIDKVKASGARVVCFAPSVALGKKMLRSGADALIIEGNEAGGHIGPVATSILVQEILPFFEEVPVFVAGGIGAGTMIASYLKMGAAGLQLGTRFVATEECSAHENFKKVFLKAKSRDAVPTAQFDPSLPVIPVRAIVNEGTKEFNALQLEMLKKVKDEEISVQDAQLKLEEYWLGALRKAVVDGDIVHGSLMAGQSVGLVKKITSVQEVIDELVTDAERALERGI